MIGKAELWCENNSMRFRLRYVSPSQGHTQRGQAALLLLMLIAAAIAGLVYYMVDPTSGDLRRDRATAEVLVKARDALIGHAAASATRPGQLPCPDTNDDGIAEPPDSSGCPSGNIGRLPWQTLGLDDLWDGAGERLWYAVSAVFTRNSTSCCFDNDTRGTLTVSHDKAANTITDQAVAVIFASGPVLAGQNRSAGNTNNPANYLDTMDAVNNAAPAGPFISGQMSPTFNDKLYVITTAHLWPAVEIRVARELLKALKKFKDNSVCNCYPWAANLFDDDGVSPRRHGGVPIENANVSSDDEWGGVGNGTPGGIPPAPTWMTGNNEWGKQFYYAVADRARPGGDPAGSSLMVDGSPKDLVIITPGPAGAICREYSNPPTCTTGYRGESRSLDNYVDALPSSPTDENRNGDDIFVTPPPSVGFPRDRIFYCPATPPDAVC